ncbi:hypothetical protein RHGRI_016601 [Rhododendron griersonianum]|uniref:Aminotransferase-like plant mobile domain-containing protein n=1 Tax=Rhododendron griersonianum TaxID=479676 RepID=A0AAV6JUN7_9ERIC|nr:hypothetical protein RHGRI_016601 [Rhododendron griersonianum]
MSKWWHEGYLGKYYDNTYDGSSNEEGNDEEEVNDEELSEEEGDICPPCPTKKKKSKGDSKKKKKVPLFIKTRCSPRKFVSLISTLTTDQSDAIKAFNPFHTLLDVKCGHMHRAFAMHLVHCFNPQTCSIEFRRGVVVHITEEDVARVLGMPIGDTPVPTECLELHRRKIEEDFSGGYKGIEIITLENEIKKGHTDGRFHRAYMLFTLACLLCPTTKEVAGNRLFPGVVADDLETLKTYKWPAFVIYFDLNPLDVEVGKELEAPIGLWTKELIDIQISKEAEDKPIEDSFFFSVPSPQFEKSGDGIAFVSIFHRFMICIDMYKDYMRQFMNNSKSLHQMDAAMGEPVVGSPQDGPRAQPVEDEGHLPQFRGNFELHQYDEHGEGEEEEEGD